MTDTNWTVPCRAPRLPCRAPRRLHLRHTPVLLAIALAFLPVVLTGAEESRPTPGDVTTPARSQTLDVRGTPDEFGEPGRNPTDHAPASITNAPLYRLLPSGAFERSSIGESGWTRVSGLPARVLPASLAGQPLPVTAFSVDPMDGNRLLAAVGPRLFLGTEAGATWTEVDVSGTVNRSTYVTAIAIDPNGTDRWLLGTSYDGLYLTEDGGLTWTDITADWTIGPLYLGAGFYEEIAHLEIGPDGTVIVEIGMGGGFVSLDLATRSATRLRPLVDGARTYRAPARQTGPTWTKPGAPNLNPVTAASRAAGVAGDPAPDPRAASRRELAAARTGIYLAAPNATADKLPAYFDYVLRHGFNSIVVDLKDDYGRITFNTTLELPRTLDAVQPFVDVPALVRMAHEREIYIIARIVVFKDQKLYRYDSNRLALWDSTRNRPWGVFRAVTDEQTNEERLVQVEHWVDPYSPEVWDYVVSIAEEAAALGVDEIQFDYVRFPSDGNTASIENRFAPGGAGRVEALEAFLSTARDRLEVPIGIDVFGFNAWSRMGYLGQDITRLGRYVDVISPMFYPSHFALPFLADLSYLDRSRVIYDDGTRRAREIAQAAGDSVLIRPYVQAFLIGRELEYEAPDYLRYLQLQLEGAAAAGSDGYTLWNASGRYYMLP